MSAPFFSKGIQVLLVIFLVIGASAPSIYFYKKYRSAQNALQNPAVYVQQETKLLKERVGKFIELPTDEEPTIATVTDADRLREQPFFANAQNGDRVFIFTRAHKAILYRPSTNKIIEVAPVNIGNNQATPSAEQVTNPLSHETPVTPTAKVTPTKPSTPRPSPIGE